MTQPRLNRRGRRIEASKAKNRTLEQQKKVDEAVEEALATKPASKPENPKIPFCKAPGCGGRAFTKRGLCRKHEEMFLFVYFLFTAPTKKSDLLLPGEQQGGKQMTNFDMLIRGKL